MAVRTSTPNPLANNQETKVKVRKPFSNSAREIRNAILREHFGYTDSDIEELDRQMPGKFIITEIGSNKEATAEQIKNSPVDPIDGLLPVSLNDFWIKTLPGFLERRKASVIFKPSAALPMQS